MHEKVPRTFYFIVSSPGGVAEAIFNVNFTLKHKTTGSSQLSSSSSSSSSSGPFGSSSLASAASASASGGGLSSGGSGYKINTNTINNLPGNSLDEDEELMEPEEIHFPIFGSGANCPLSVCKHHSTLYRCYSVLLALLTCFRYVLLKY